MNVGELRRALEGVSDTREVCFHDEGWYCVAERASTRSMVAAVDAGFSCGDFVLAKEYHAFCPSTEARLLFVIE